MLNIDNIISQSLDTNQLLIDFDTINCPNPYLSENFTLSNEENKIQMQWGTIYDVQEGGGKTTFIKNTKFNGKLCYITSRLALIQDFEDNKDWSKIKKNDKDIFTIPDSNRVFSTIQSLNKNTIKSLINKGYFFILDEIHSYFDFSDTYNKLREFPTNKTICLTASITEILYNETSCYYNIKKIILNRQQRLLNLSIYRCSDNIPDSAYDLILSSLYKNINNKHKSLVYLNNKDCIKKIYGNMPDNLKQCTSLYYTESSDNIDFNILYNEYASKQLSEFKSNPNKKIMLCTKKMGIGIDIKNLIDNIFIFSTDPFEVSQLCNRERKNNLNVHWFITTNMWKGKDDNRYWSLHKNTKMIWTNKLNINMNYFEPHFVQYMYKTNPELLINNTIHLLRRNFIINPMGEIHKTNKELWLIKVQDIIGCISSIKKTNECLIDNIENNTLIKDNIKLLSNISNKEWEEMNNTKKIELYKSIYKTPNDTIIAKCKTLIENKNIIPNNELITIQEEFEKIALSVNPKQKVAGSIIWGYIKIYYHWNLDKQSNTWIKGRKGKAVGKNYNPDKHIKTFDDGTKCTINEYMELHNCSRKTANKHIIK